MSIAFLQDAWFLLLGVLLAGYAILDGFDLGVGVLHIFAKGDQERRVHLNAIAPVWDGNEVWLLTAGGAMFAAFPPVYASVFSGFYLAFMLLLLALIARAVSLEFRGKVESARWAAAWDVGFAAGSFVPALLFGVAMANILKGLPIDKEGFYQGTFLDLLSPYAVLVGVTGVALFVMHGAIWMMIKGDEVLHERMRKWAIGAWAAFALLFAASSAASALFAGERMTAGLGRPLALVALAALVAGLLGVVFFVVKRMPRCAFTCSSVTIAAMLGIVGLSLYPDLVPSTLDPAYSLTVRNASSSAGTLSVMLVVALVGMPLVLGYTIFIYRKFAGRVVLHDESY